MSLHDGQVFGIASDVEHVGTYTSGMPLTLGLEWDADGYLHVSGDAGSATLSHSVLDASGLHVVVANKDSTDGFLLDRLALRSALTGSVGQPGGPLSSPRTDRLIDTDSHYSNSDLDDRYRLKPAILRPRRSGRANRGCVCVDPQGVSHGS